MKKIDITITEQQIEHIKQFCEQTGLSRSDVIRRAVEAYLRQHPPQSEKTPAAIDAAS